jgi:hypothetical protein
MKVDRQINPNWLAEFDAIIRNTRRVTGPQCGHLSCELRFGLSRCRLVQLGGAIMPRALEMPAFLDEHGQQLWSAFVATREHTIAAQRELRTLAPSMRRNIRPGGTPDPSIIARYRAAAADAADADAARRAAERDYHAYRRMLLARAYLTGHHRQTAASTSLHAK